ARAGTIFLTYQEPGDGFAPKVLTDVGGYSLAAQTSRVRPGITLAGVDLDRGRESQWLLLANSARASEGHGFAAPARPISPGLRPDDPWREFANSISNGPEHWNRIVIRQAVPGATGSKSGCSAPIFARTGRISRLIREVAEGRSMKCQPPEVPLETRSLLYAGAWVAAYLGVTIIFPLLEGRTPELKDFLIYAVCSWLLPMGLIAWFDP